MTDIFVDTTRRDTTCGCFGCDTDTDPSEGGYDSSGSSNSKKRAPSLFTTQRFKQARKTTDDNQLPDDTVDVDLAKELSALTFQERERVTDELHGVAQTPVETPEFVARSLQAMDRAIKNTPKRNRKAMERAFFLRPSFASDAKFKLLFLRAEDFDPPKAAARMIAYFEAKRILFGDDKLAKKRVTLEDLSPVDIKFIFHSQFFAFLESQWEYLDASGRPIIFSNISKFDFDDYHTSNRGLWYVAMSMTLPEDDEETATAGSVKGFSNILHFPRDTPLQSSLPKIIEGCNQCIPLFVESLPVRFTSAHFCYSNPAMRVPISIIQQGLGKRTRIRMRVHYGTPLEIRYAMLPFGIRCPPNVNRIQEESDSTKKKHTWDMDQCVERRREMEQRREAIERDREMKSGILLYPRHPKDVLIGRGQSYKEHPGNQYYQALIESKLDQYIAAPGNFEKTCISMEVVQTVQDEGGRFLALVEGKGWKILENLVARDKTSNSFRSKNTCNRNAARK